MSEQFGADPNIKSGSSEFKCGFIRRLLGIVRGMNSTEWHSSSEMQLSVNYNDAHWEEEEGEDHEVCCTFYHLCHNIYTQT